MSSMSAPKRFRVSPEARAKVLRAVVRDDSKVRVSLNGSRTVGPSSTAARPAPSSRPTPPPRSEG